MTSTDPTDVFFYKDLTSGWKVGKAPELEKRYEQCRETIDAGQYALHLQYALPKNGGT